MIFDSCSYNLVIFFDLLIVKSLISDRDAEQVTINFGERNRLLPLEPWIKDDVFEIELVKQLGFYASVLQIERCGSIYRNKKEIHK